MTCVTDRSQRGEEGGKRDDTTSKRCLHIQVATGVVVYRIGVGMGGFVAR